MKKTFKKVLAATCFCTVLMTPIVSFAAQPENVDAITNGIMSGVITGSDVNLRSDYGMAVIGLVQKGDQYTFVSEERRAYGGYLYRRLIMNSGAQKGKIGWIAVDYLSYFG